MKMFNHLIKYIFLILESKKFLRENKRVKQFSVIRNSCGIAAEKPQKFFRNTRGKSRREKKNPRKKNFEKKKKKKK